MGVEQRQLLLAVHRVAGVVDVERDRRRRAREGAAEGIDQGSRHARHLAARGRVLQTAHGGLGTEIAAALRRPAHGQFEEGIAAQGVAVVGILISAGDREHAEAKHRRQRVDHPLRVAPLPDAARQRLGQAEPALRRAQQHQPAVRRDRPALEIGGYLLAADGWKIEREKGIFGHGGRRAFVASVERHWETNFYPITTTYATFATSLSGLRVESRTGAPASGSGGSSVAFASGRSPAPMAAFPVPAHRTQRADFPHSALQWDHASRTRNTRATTGRR